MRLAKIVVSQYPDDISYITTFSMENFENPSWTEEVILSLKKDFDEGADGVKVWKDIGMTFRDSLGTFILIDDSKFDPILDFIASKGKLLCSLLRSGAWPEFSVCAVHFAVLLRRCLILVAGAVRRLGVFRHDADGAVHGQHAAGTEGFFRAAFVRADGSVRRVPRALGRRLTRGDVGEPPPHPCRCGGGGRPIRRKSGRRPRRRGPFPF